MRNIIFGILALFIAGPIGCSDLVEKPDKKKQPCNQILIQQRIIKEKLKQIEKKIKRKR